MISVGKNLSIDDVIAVSNGHKISLSKSSIEKIKKSRKEVDIIVKSGKTKYGINTGIGALLDKSLEPDQIEDFQKNLVRSHAAGTGKPFSIEIVRGAMFIQLSQLSKGHSGIRPEVAQIITKMLNSHVTPYVPSKGSLGASGDLAPLAHVALSIIGEGKAYYKGKLMDSSTAFKKAKIKPLKLGAKEGLSLINGTQFMSSIGCHLIDKAQKLLKISDIATSLTLEALQSKTNFLDERIHKLKPYKGQMDCASNIRKLIRSGSISSPEAKTKIQDAYSIRCTPQIHGGCREALDFCKTIIETEINSITDNPLIVGGDVVSGGNFHGQHIAIALDLFAISMTKISSVSERRINRLMDPSLSGLPAFLAKEGGLNSGYMIAQYTAAHLVSENRIFSTPASIDSIPVSANQEDVVSMGMTSASKATDILENTKVILGTELLCASQAIDKNVYHSLGSGTKAAFKSIRKKVPELKKDRKVYIDVKKVCSMIDDNSILDKVETVSGKLL